VEGTVREVKRRVRVVASSYRAIDRSVTRWIVVTIGGMEFGGKMGACRTHQKQTIASDDQSVMWFHCQTQLNGSTSAWGKDTWVQRNVVE